MAHAPAPEPTAPPKWYAPIIGLIFGALVLGSVALATAAANDNPDPHGDHSSEEDHGDDDHGEEGNDDDH